MSFRGTIDNWADKIEEFSGKEYELEHLPSDKQKSMLGLLAVWAAATIVPSAFLTGGAMGNSLTFPEFAATFFAGSFMMFVLACLVGYIAHDLGLTFHTLSRFFFGVRGSYIPSTLQVITRIGWGAVSLAFAVSFVVDLFAVDGFFLVTAILGGFYLITALMGFNGLKWISYIAIPVFLGVYIFGLVGPIGLETPAGPMEEPVPLTAAIGIAASFWAAGSLVAADWLRFGQSMRDVVVSSAIALLGFNLIALGLGYFSVVATGNPDISAGIADAGFIVPATFAIVLITWTTVDNWLYSGSLGVSNIFNIRKVYAVVLLGIVMIITAGFQVHTLVIPWLELLGAFLPPLAGPILVEYYVLKNKMQFDMTDINYDINGVAVGAWAIGSGVGYLAPAVYIVPLVAIVVSIIAYLVLYLVFRSTALYPSATISQSSPPADD